VCGRVGRVLFPMGCLVGYSIWGWAGPVMYNSFGSRVTQEPARVWLIKNRVKFLAQLVTHFQRSESSRVTNESSRASYRVMSFLSSPSCRQWQATTIVALRRRGGTLVI
jgi:hypothetical protein